MLTDTPTGTMTVPGLITKGQKVGGAQLLETPHFSKIGYSFHSLAYETTQPTKANLPLTTVSPLDSDCVACGMCISHSATLTFQIEGPSPWFCLQRWPTLCLWSVSLSKQTCFTLLWLALEFFPAWSQGSSLGWPIPETHQRPGTGPPSYTPFFHTIAPALFTRAKKVEATQVSINRWVNKQNMAYTSETVFIQHEKERKFWHMRQNRWTFGHYAA